MSERWDDHYQMITDLINAQRARRYVPPPPAVIPTTTPTINPNDPGGMLSENWQGGANGGNTGGAGGFDNGGVAGNMSAIDLGGWGPTAAALAGGLLGTAVAGPFGGALGALGGRQAASAFGGTPTGPQPQPQDIAYGVNPNPDPGYDGSGMATGGNLDGMNAEAAANAENMGGGFNGGGLYQKGGYTGAGRDGIVQPNRRAGVVHEGEMVIPAPMVQAMRRRGLLG